MLIALTANITAAISRLQISQLSANWPWYVVRASGLVAFGLLILLMLSGIGLVTGLTFRLLEPLKAWAWHRALAIALCLAILIHIVSLLLDHYIGFNIADVLIPFWSNYRRIHWWGLSLGSLLLALGIFSMYGVSVVVASSLGWIDSKKTLWRRLHYLSYLVMGFSFIHGLFLGTDLAHGRLRQLWLVLGALLLLATISRLARRGSLKNSNKAI